MTLNSTPDGYCPVRPVVRELGVGGWPRASMPTHAGTNSSPGMSRTTSSAAASLHAGGGARGVRGRQRWRPPTTAKSRPARHSLARTGRTMRCQPSGDSDRRWGRASGTSSRETKVQEPTWWCASVQVAPVGRWTSPHAPCNATSSSTEGLCSSGRSSGLTRGVTSSSVRSEFVKHVGDA